MKRALISTAGAIGAAAMLAAPAGAGPGSCGGYERAERDASVMPASMNGYKDIVETAVGAGQFKTLVAAVKAAGLVNALQGDGPFTVFAPTDAAFADLPEGTVSNLLKPENRDLLRSILTYHVVPGEVPASRVVGLDRAETLNGQRIDIAVRDGGVRIDKARVVKADIDCSNGIIHVIDRVIMPSTSNIVETAAEAGSFSTLLKAATEAGLAGTLSGDGPFTVFAPTDEAFQDLGMGTVRDLLKPENRSKLRSILKYHVVSGRVFADEAIEARRAKTLEGGEVRARIVDGRVRINQARVLNSDIEASNGIVHVIDSVLIPEN